MRSDGGFTLTWTVGAVLNWPELYEAGGAKPPRCPPAGARARFEGATGRAPKGREDDDEESPRFGVSKPTAAEERCRESDR